MRLLYFSNEFPNDDIQELYRGLLVRSKERQHPHLARFIEDASLAVKDELRRLPAAQRALVPTFETVFELADYPQLRKGPLCGSIDGVLLCVLQLATFIGYLEEHPHDLSLDPEDTHLAGLGTGLLATAAVSLSPTLAELPWAAAEVIRVAFRLGVHVDEISGNLEPRDMSGAAPDSWASVIPGVSPDEVKQELELHCEREGLPLSGKIFVSALSKASVTISGPPSKLKALFRDNDFFRDRQCVNLPVYGGLCHAAHVYGPENVRSVVRTDFMDSLDSRLTPRLPVLCTSSGAPYKVESATQLFEAIVSELMTQAIQWDEVVSGVVDELHTTCDPTCEIFVFRKSQAVSDLTAALKEVPQLKTTTRDLMAWAVKKSGADGSSSESRGPMQSKIAIVGMACRLPGGASDPEKFWDLLEKGLDVHRKIPADRFDLETHYDPTGKSLNKSQTEYGCFIDEPGLFDAPFFNMSPKEAMQTDPQGRLALVTAYEALEHAGYVPNRTAATHLHRVGTFYGQAADDYREVNQGQEVGTYYIPGGCRAFVPGRINYFFKFWGPSFSVDTACSSSLATIQAACTSLWAGDCDTAVSGGVNVLTNCDGFAGLSQGHFLTKGPNACKTWDVEADGYCRADAIGSLVMKRLEDAEADNDNILGVILSAATNHSAEAISITHPLAEAQSELTRKVMHRAGVDPLDVGFVEMHGTGTQAGDMEEIKSVTDVFAPSAGPVRRRSSKQPLYIGAVKSNVGHSESAAGVTAMLKVLLMFQKQAIPPHVGIKNSLTPKFPKDMDKRNVHIPFQKTEWARTPGKKRIAVVNNFSAAGGNTSIALEEPPLREVCEGNDPRPSHVVTVSAKSKRSLEGNLQRYLSYLEAHPGASIANLSYTTTARRHHHNYRVTACVQDTAQLKKQLESSLGTVESTKPIPATGAPSVAFAFTGQGASYQSMNLELYHSCPYYQSQIQHLDSLAQSQGFPSFIPALDGSFPQDHTHKPVVTQLALVCTEIALARYWNLLGVQPSVVIGHSLGEYAAMHVAGVLSASDIIYLVGQRAQLLERKCLIGSHKMMAVSATLEEIEQSAGGRPYEIACINGPKQIVLSGPRDDIDALGEVLKGAGHRSQCLEVAFAFHSAQTDAILDDFEATAKKAVVFKEPHIPYISPLLRKVVCDGKTINANYVRRATREAVDFVGALDIAQKQHMIDDKTAWIEMGPHPVCMGFVKTNIPSANITVPSLRRGQNNWTTMADSMCALHAAGIELSWNEFHRPFEGNLRLLDLPTYAWNEKKYWMQYTGDWCLTKGNTHYLDNSNKATTRAIETGPASLPKSSLRTSTVQHILEESFDGTSGKITMQSDLMQQDFFAAAHGHGMNGCGVVTSSIHADIAYTLGEYLYRKIRPDAGKVDMDVSNLVVVKGLVAQKYIKTPQLIRVSIETSDINSGVAQLQWYNVNPDGSVDEPFATAQLQYGDVNEWLNTWGSMTHLIESRVEALKRMCDEGKATRFSHSMAYRLFANNLVDYASKYRGMQSVVVHELEAFADITLSNERSGTWTIPPQYIDSVAHLAGFVMNCSDAMDTQNNFCVTPGWKSMRFATKLEAGARYRSYVKMIPTAEDPSVFTGDVYIMQNDKIVGMVGAITFRKYPRLLISRFFSPPDAAHAQSASKPAAKPAAQAAALPKAALSKPAATAQAKAVVKPPAVSQATSSGSSTPQEALWSPSSTESCSQPPTPKTPAVSKPTMPNSKVAPPGPIVEVSGGNSTVSKAMELIAKEAALDIADLSDEASFASLGVDSLMSLVIAEKFRDELGVQVSGGLFLEYPTISDLRSWLVEYYS